MSSNGSRTLDEVRLCATCQKIFEAIDPDLDDLHPHHGSKAELERAAKWGCRLCTAFLSKFHSTIDPTDPHLDNGVFWNVFADKNGSSSLSVSLSDER